MQDIEIAGKGMEIGEQFRLDAGRRAHVSLADDDEGVDEQEDAEEITGYFDPEPFDQEIVDEAGDFTEETSGEAVQWGHEKTGDILQAYFHSMGNPPILSRREETDIARKLEEGRNALRQIIQALPLYRQLTRRDGPQQDDRTDEALTACVEILGKYMASIETAERKLGAGSALRPSLRVIRGRDEQELRDAYSEAEAAIGIGRDELRSVWAGIVLAQRCITEARDALVIHNLRLVINIAEEQGGQEIFVEGVLPESQKLSRMMMKGMGELYVPKFAKYMERKDLISLTLKSRMRQAEFSSFVDIMSEPTLVDTRHKQDQDRFAQALYSRGIINISYVFNEEFIALEREMPWRARLTLSRMRKDIKMVPILQQMMGREIKDIRINLLRDALRPIRQSDLLCAILRNSDLVTTSRDLEETIEDEIVSSLKKQYLLNTSKIFLREHLDLKKLQKQDVFEEKSNRLVKKISRRLKEAATPETGNLLEEFFRHQLITLEDLPPALKDKIILERLTDKFLSYTDQFFLQLDQAKDKEAFLNCGNLFCQDDSRTDPTRSFFGDSSNL